MADIAVQENPEQVVATCRHHWLIATPEGAMSMGHCKICGELREFYNSATDSLWERDGGSGSASWNQSVKPTPTGSPVDEGF